MIFKSIVTYVATGIVFFFTVPGAFTASQSSHDRIFRIGYIRGQRWGENSPQFRLFVRTLHGFGYTRGKNLFVNHTRIPGTSPLQLKRQLEVAPVDIVVAVGTLATRTAMKATSTIPIMFLSVGAPVAKGLVESLSHPGQNVTGFAYNSIQVASKRLELLKEALPRTRRVAVIYRPKQHLAILRSIEETAAVLGLTVVKVPMSRRDDHDMSRVFATLENSAEAVYVQCPCPVAMRAPLLKFAAEHGLPLISTDDSLTRNGGLISLGSDTMGMIKSAAAYVDRLLKGAYPGDLPVQQLDDIRLTINLKSARALGVTLSPELLMRATKVIPERIQFVEIDGQEYFVSRRGYRISPPTAGAWEADSDGKLNVVFRQKDGTGFITTWTGFKAATDSLAETSEQWVRGMARKQGWSGVLIRDQLALRLDGREAYATIFEYRDNGGEARTDRSYFIHEPGSDRDLIRIRFSASRENYRTLIRTFDEVLASFSFL